MDTVQNLVNNLREDDNEFYEESNTLKSGNTSSMELEENNDDYEEESENTEELFDSNIWELYYENKTSDLKLLENTSDYQIIESKEVFFEANEENPYSYFKEFFTDEIIEIIIKETELYYQDNLKERTLNENSKDKLKKFSRIKRWKTPTKESIECYLGIILWMGIHSNNNYKGKISR